MTFSKTFKNIAFASALSFLALPVAAQDLLASQAPVDKKMKAVDTIALKQLIEREELSTPAAQLYNDWNNTHAHAVSDMPEHFVINLRNFCMPTPSRVVTSNFGARWGRQHKGLDIKVYTGDTIRAAFSGRVRVVKYDGHGYGKYVVIRHSNGLETVYGHLSKQLVDENQEVRAGAVIGLGGSTGRSTGSHLHFETRLCGVALNPALLFDFRNQDVTGDEYVYDRRTYAQESSEATQLRGKVGNGGYTRDQIYGEVASSNTKSQAEESTEKLFHKVAKGETLASIAAKRGISVDTLCKLNGLRKNDNVSAGRILRYS